MAGALYGPVPGQLFHEKFALMFPLSKHCQRTFMNIHRHKDETHCTVRGCDIQLILLVMPFVLQFFFQSNGHAANAYTRGGSSAHGCGTREEGARGAQEAGPGRAGSAAETCPNNQTGEEKGVSRQRGPREKGRVSEILHEFGETLASGCGPGGSEGSCCIERPQTT